MQNFRCEQLHDECASSFSSSLLREVIWATVDVCLRMVLDIC